jgi:hypothetical protein
LYFRNGMFGFRKNSIFNLVGGRRSTACLLPKFFRVAVTAVSRRPPTVD